MDAFAEILKSSVKMRHCSAGTLRLKAPWGLTVESPRLTAAYGVRDGGPCWLTVPASESVRLVPGDMALVTGAHAIQSSPEALTTSIVDAFVEHGFPPFAPEHEPDRPLHLGWGGAGPETRMLALAFNLAGGERHPLLLSLPPCIVLRASHGPLPWMPAAIAFLTSVGAKSPGYGASVRLLAELITVGIISSHLAGEAQSTRGWMRGLTDPAIGKALQAIHQNPGQAWTVAALAQVAGCSRTSFATRFAELVETTPIEYVTQWRMHLAGQQILDSRTNLTQLAFELGYTSTAAFRDAFRRYHGVPPSRYLEKASDTPGRAEAAVPVH